ncbi:MAG: hypothetical protein AAF589_05165 [Planctomycetota bacterium]
MKTTIAPILVAFALAAVTPRSALAQNDSVRTTKGTEAGEVEKMSAVGVTLKRGSVSKNIPVSEIESVRFADEPSELTQARVNARNGGYRTALNKLSGVNAAGIVNPYIKQELAFYKAYCQARLALLGEEDLTAAGRDLNTFRQNGKQNFHYLQAVELLGDLLASSGRYSQAEKMYAEVAKAPFPAYKVRANVLVGRSLQGQDKHAEAIQRFEAAIRLGGEDAEEKSQQLEAQLGKAVSLAATGKIGQGVKLVQQVLAAADPAQDRLLARAYNALGACYVQGGKSKDALFAFLHVDLLFANVPESHAEALYHLVALWQETGKPQESKQAREKLETRYASSAWAKKL